MARREAGQLGIAHRVARVTPFRRGGWLNGFVAASPGDEEEERRAQAVITALPLPHFGDYVLGRLPNGLWAAVVKRDGGYGMAKESLKVQPSGYCLRCLNPPKPLPPEVGGEILARYIAHIRFDLPSMIEKAERQRADREAAPARRRQLLAEVRRAGESLLPPSPRSATRKKPS